MTTVAAAPVQVLMHSPRVLGGGMEIHIVHLSIELRREGAGVTLVVHERFGEQCGRRQLLEEARVEFIDLPDWSRLPRFARLLRSRLLVGGRIGERKFDLVICHGCGGSHPWFKRFTAPRGLFIWHDHSAGSAVSAGTGRFVEAASRPYPWWVIRAARAADLVITGSQRGERNLTEIQAIRGPVLVLPPLDFLDDAPRATERPVGKGALHLTAFGGLNDLKGTRALLGVWTSLQIAPAHLHFRGHDPDARAQGYADGLGIANVHFHGTYCPDELPIHMAATDIGLVCSLSEGYGLTALELMAHGVPFVMTRVGAAEQLAAGNPDTELAPLTDEGVRGAIERLAFKVRNGLTSRKRLQQHYLRHFSYASFASRYKRELLGRVRPG
jgi:glycosyltransferase involved in cell wall biosynthesis